METKKAKLREIETRVVVVRGWGKCWPKSTNFQLEEEYVMGTSCTAW